MNRKTTRENYAVCFSSWIWTFVFILSIITESSQNLSVEDKMKDMSKDLLLYCRILENFLKPLAQMKKMESEVRNLSLTVNHQGGKISELEKKHGDSKAPRSMSLPHNDQLATVDSRMDQLNREWVRAEIRLANLEKQWEDLGRQLADETPLSFQQTSEQKLKDRFRELRKAFEKLEGEKREILSKWQTAKDRMGNLRDKFHTADNCQNELESQFNTLKDSSEPYLRGSAGKTITFSETPPSCHSLGVAQTDAALP